MPRDRMTRFAKYRPAKAMVPALLLVILCLAAMAAAGSAVWFSLGAPGSFAAGPTASVSRGADIASTDVPPMPESFKFREDIAVEDAIAINAAVPESKEPVVAAPPLIIGAGDGKLRAIDCLTAAIYYEAASESPVGQQAVAQVVMNRARHPAFPGSICAVVFQGSARSTGCQFSFTCDGSLTRRPTAYGWARARQVAAMALSGFVEPSIGLATHYHTTSVVPYWSANLTKLRTIGAHIFYRWNGNNGKRQAFTNRYTRIEVTPDTLAANLQGFLLADSGIRPPAETIELAELPLVPLPPVSGSATEKPHALQAASGQTNASKQKHDLILDGKGTQLNERKTRLVIDAAPAI
jgi:hypothetical protein